MATTDTVERLIFRMSAVLPDRKMLPEAVDIYQELLEDIPDEVLVKAVRECLLKCRFFPTIAEIREQAEPILQEWNLEHQRLIEANAYALCPENIWWDKEKNMPHCRIEEGDHPEQCQLVGSGRCAKFDNKYRDKGGVNA